MLKIKLNILNQRTYKRAKKYCNWGFNRFGLASRIAASAFGSNASTIGVLKTS
jgi:trans-2-enoyl-CoA reductase